jgi:hypothetical protein
MSYPACETSPASLARREARPVTFVPALRPALGGPGGVPTHLASVVTEDNAQRS